MHKDTNVYGDAGIQHIASNRDNYDLLEIRRGSHFELIVEPQLDNLLRMSANPDSYTKDDIVSGMQESVRISCISATEPQLSISPIDIPRGNSSIKAAGQPSWNSPLSFSFNDYIGLEPMEFFKAWRELAYSSYTDRGGRMKNYKRTCYLVLYGYDYQVIRIWEIMGCFPTSVQPGNLSQGSGGKLDFSVQISFDRARQIDPKQLYVTDSFY